MYFNEILLIIKKYIFNNLIILTNFLNNSCKIVLVKKIVCKRINYV